MPSLGANSISIATAHILDPLCFLLGEFQSLNATTAITFPTIQFTKPDGTKTDPEARNLADSILIQGVLEGGITAGFMNSFTTEALPDTFEWIISGEQGSLKFSGASSFLAISPPMLYLHTKDAKKVPTEGTPSKTNEASDWEEVDVGPPTPGFGGVGPVYEAFASGKKGTYVDFDAAVTRHKMVEAIYRSTEKGTRETY